MDYMSLGLGQSGESIFLVGLEVCVYFDATVDYLDFKSDDSDVDVVMKPELADLEDLATVAGAEDREVVVAGIEQLLHMDADNVAPKVDLAKLGEFRISH